MRTSKLLLSTELQLSHPEVSILRDQLETLGRHLRWNSKLSDQIRLVFAEWAANLVKHSDLDLVEVKLVQAVDRLSLVFGDGATFPATTDSDIPDFESESGRGIWLVTQMTDEVIQTDAETCFCWEHEQATNRYRVLLVDDDPVVTTLAKEYLSKHFQIEAADTVSTAKDLLARQSFDLVVCDNDLPDEDGLTFRRNLLNSRATDLMPFVFISGQAPDKTSFGLGGLTVDRFLPKPFSRQSIVSMCLEAIQTQALIKRRIYDQFLTTSAQRVLIDQPSEPSTGLKIHHQTTDQGGGDFFLIQTAESGRFLLLGDCMGHDPSSQWYAHLWVGYLRGAMAAFRSSTGVQALTQHLVDVALTDRLLEESCLTLALVFESDEGWVEAISLGHPLPVLQDQSELIEIGSQYGMLGLRQINIAEPSRHIWSHGMRLALYTDGVTENAFMPSQNHGNSPSLADTLRQTNTDSLDSALKSIQRACAESKADDATVILLEADYA